MNKIEYYKSFVNPQDTSRHYTCLTNYNLKIDGFLPNIPLAPISILSRGCTPDDPALETGLVIQENFNREGS